jgi:peptidoglycan/LPS O-acetylase OafA/YrhL
MLEHFQLRTMKNSIGIGGTIGRRDRADETLAPQTTGYEARSQYVDIPRLEFAPATPQTASNRFGAGERRVSQFNSEASSRPVHLKYRPDIDGLRALAIVSVTAFHAFPDYMAGGFIGVDIFFVISGFLISGIIFSRIEAGNFSYIDFYVGRAKRILPALTIVIAATLAIGWVVLFSSEYKNLGANAFAASIFASNIKLWREVGYFDTNAHYKALLHLWSLGVEEQFYMFWPILAVFVWRRWNMALVILAIGIVSFCANIYLTYTDPIAAFYTPLARFWELMVGGGLAFLGLYRHRSIEVRSHFLSVVGMALIILGLALTTKDSAFPGWLAVLPALGAAFVISAGPNALLNRFVLSNPAMVWIGLISYPLYLWHWPVLAYLRVMEGGELPPSQAAAAVALAVVFAFLTYAIIEKGVKALVQPRLISLILCGLLVLFGVSGLAIRAFNGVSSRDINELNVSDNWVGDVSSDLTDACGMTPQEKRGIANCASDKRNTPVFALLGDSKAAALFPGLVRTSDEKGRWLLIGGTGPHGAPIPVISDAEPYKAFQQQTIAASDAIARNPAIRVVVLTAAIRSLFLTDEDRYLEDLPKSPNYKIALDGLDRMIAKFAAAGKTVVITIDNPTLADPLECMTRRTQIKFLATLFDHKKNYRCAISIDENRRRMKSYLDLLGELSTKWGTRLIIYDPVNALCIKEKNLCPSERNGHLLYSYGDHISDYASGLMARELTQRLRGMAL